MTKYNFLAPLRIMALVCFVHQGLFAAVNGTVVPVNVTGCYGNQNGSITITGSSGSVSGFYEYSINGGGTWQSSNIFNSLSAGAYNVQMRDPQNTGNSKAFATTNITQPVQLSATVNSTNATSCTVNDGSITISSPSGGSGNYEFMLSYSNIWTTNMSYTGLSNGYYSIKIRDASNTSCEAMLNNSLYISAPGAVNATFSVTDASTCGGTNGSISITGATGGSGTYEYSKDDGATWQLTGNFTGLSANGYGIKARDKTNTSCVWSSYANVNQPSSLSASYSTVKASGCNTSDASISITSPTGASAFEYSIDYGNSWQASGSYTNLYGAWYSIRIRDKNTPLCFKELASGIDLHGPGSVSANWNAIDVTTCGGNNGQIVISNVTGGSGLYEYSKDDGNTWQSSGTYTGLNANGYGLRVRDKNNPSCSWSSYAYVNQPSNLSASYSFVKASGCSTTDGSITITNPSGGSSQYEYSIDFGKSWQPSGTYTNLYSAFYSTRIRDKNSPLCFKDLSNGVDLHGPGAVSANWSATDATTCGGSNGQIVLSNATGGSGNYEYSIDDGKTWQATGTFTGLTANGYGTRVRDKNNPSCSWSSYVYINQPSTLSATVQSTAPTTCTGVDGTITITSPTGGSGQYEYSINTNNNNNTTWSTNASFTSLQSGTYGVSIRDKNNPGCYKTLNNNLSLMGPGSVSFSLNHTDVTTCGGNDGTITVNNATGGSGQYEASKDLGATWQSTQLFSGLLQGTYEIRVRDKNNTQCQSNNYEYVGSPTNIDATINVTNTSACGTSDGAIVISSATGGSGSFEYSIDGGAHWKSNGTFSGLMADNYDVRIRDFNNKPCYKILQDHVEVNMPVKLQADVSSVNISACGANDGQIILSNFSGGSGQYEFSITGGASWGSASTFTNLLPGSYNAAMRDKNAPLCRAGGIITLVAPLQVSATLASSNVSPCYGNNNGSITLTNPTGGGGTYQYTINGGISWQTNGSYTSLAPGVYDVRVRDAASPTCVSILSSGLLIAQPGQLITTLSKTDVTCNGTSTGSILLSNSAGGSNTFEYSINGGSTWQSNNSFATLPAGTYNVKMRDAANPTCLISLNASLNITQPPLLAATLTSQNISCNGANDGSIVFSNISGGGGTYEFTKDGGTSWQNVTSYTSLGPGSYNVKLRDAAKTSCVVPLNAAVSITQLPALAATFNSTNATSCLNNDGTITITGVSGGSGAFEYSKDNGVTWQTPASYSNLSSGSYAVKVRDAAHTGCTIGQPKVITAPGQVSATLGSTDVTVCYGNSNGAITISSPTGATTYGYSINGGVSWQGSGSYTGLPAGIYDVRIRDAAATACTSILASGLAITQPGQLSATVTKTDVLCNGASTGSISLSNSTGGGGTYQYSLNNSTWQSGTGFSSLPSATYSVYIRDAVNTSCTATLNNNNLTITQLGLLSATATKQNISCNGTSDGSITFSSISGGSGSYEFSKNNGSSWENLTAYSGLAAATYTVKLRDAVNTSCIVTVSSSLVISLPVLPSAPVASSIVQPTCSTATGTVNVTVQNGGETYSFDNGSNFQAGNSKSGLAPGNYSIVIKSTDGCSSIATQATVNAQPITPATPAITSTVQPTCSTATGTINVTVQNVGETYSFDNGANFQGGNSKSGLVAGNYNVVIKSSGGCNSVATQATVNAQPITPATPAIASIVQGTCAVPSGTITVTQQNAGETYSFDNGGSFQSGNSKSGLAAGNYNVIIKSSGGCNSVATQATINTLPVVPPQPTITLSLNNTESPVLTTGAASSYQWYKDGNIIAGETLSSLTITDVGSYTVIVYSADGCASTPSAATVIVITGDIHSQNNIATELFPNPVKGTLVVNGVHDNASISVVSLSGVVQDVKFEKNTTANSKVATVNHLVSGFYILQVQDEGVNKYLKFIKE